MSRDFSKYPTLKWEELEAGMDFAVEQILKALPEFTDKFEDSASVDGFYQPVDNLSWTTGFWTGEIWLAYEYVLENPGRFARGTAAKLKEAALRQVDSFTDRIENKISVDHHDMGFLYSPSCVAAHKLVGSDRGRYAALLAADQLLTRFQEKGEFLQAWGPMGAKENYRLIIDCLNNLPLLYWASAETRDPKYRTIAEKHITTAIKVVIRDDYSTWHTFFFDPETGEPDHGATCQGYKDDSVWARGQAWGVAGLATAYRYTGRSEYIPLFERVTAYFLEHLPKDLVPYWDFTFTDGSDEPRDSSSASIAVCGMLEAARYLPEKEARYYIAVSKRIMKSLYDRYAVKDPEKSNGLVLHATYSKKSEFNTCTEGGVDECNIWGDYYYMEALTRLSKDWKQYW